MERALDAPTEPIVRRTALRTLGAAAAGGMAGLFALSGTADATAGTMRYGDYNNAGADGTTLTASLAGATLLVENSNTASNAISLRAYLVGSGVAFSAYIDAADSDGWGVFARCSTTVGYPVVSQGGRAQLYLMGPHEVPTASALQHVKGEVVFDTDGSLWVCVADGTPGTWRRLAGVQTAGSFHPISPARVYDSRRAAPGPQLPLATGASRTVSVADGRNTSTGAVTTANVVPTGATAIAYNLTITNTMGASGFLSVNEGGNATVAASIINWSAVGMTLANSSVVKLNSNREITVICGGANTSCNFIIDVLGYYL